MSLRENVSVHRTHLYGRSPVSAPGSQNELLANPSGEHGRLTTQHVPLQVLRMKVGLGAVCAGVLAAGVLLWDRCFGSATASLRRRWPSRGTGQDTATTLRAYHMGG